VIAARAVCFGAAPDGLPDTAGWIALVAQPSAMLLMTMAIWGRDLQEVLGELSSTLTGRAALIALAGVALVGVGAIAHRVQAAGPTAADPLPELPLAEYSRIESPAPPLQLIDQHGDRISLERYRGHPVFVAFAFGHCETICPLVVREALTAQRRLESSRPAVLVVTLDPWRDTPSRLSHIADQWEMGTNAHVLSGTVDEVEQALDSWGVDRARNLRTGDVVHPPQVYVVDEIGNLAYVTSGSAELLVELVNRL
jgi:protein SCO1/2